MLGDNIRKLRKERKLSINNLSKFSGVSLGYLSGIENNIEQNPTTEILVKISKALDVTIGDLFKDDRVGILENTLHDARTEILKSLNYNENTSNFTVTLAKLVSKIHDSKLSEDEASDMLNYLNFIMSKRKD